ncbi:hypothetical protein [Kineobactrum salinum]|uniref:DUF3829 domain-containing protein n=1 Tax=Kineobactrum salinum TaxID=2708301 RepID=A0A6C0U4Z7_9GAMM|nr:hypothetical protein [Kineobactrum salinum]QIB66998.1 hypothetical protein G3T16_17975 [Kineobactrum salinum]
MPNNLLIASLLTLCLSAMAADEAQLSDKAPVSVTVSLFNYAAVDIDASADRVWQLIQDYYLQVEGIAPSGYESAPLADDPAAYISGYRMVLRDEANQLIDERKVYITELDEAARRLSLYAHYLGDPQSDMRVHATYEAIETGDGARYALYAHTLLNIQVPEGKPAADYIQAQAMNLREQSQHFLDQHLDVTKRYLEAGDDETGESTSQRLDALMRDFWAAQVEAMPLAATPFPDRQAYRDYSSRPKAFGRYAEEKST